MIEKFKKPLKDLFSKENNYYRILDKPVHIGETLFTKDKISMFNSLLDMLYEKEVGGEFLNDIYYITCYFEENNIILL